MEVAGGAEEGFIREWTPCSHILNLIPPRIQTGIFSSELCLTCVDAVSEYIALGTNVGLVYWYDRKKGNIQRLRCEAANSPITFVKIVSTVDYMVGAGNAAGQVTVFQIPKEHPDNIPDNFKPKVEPKVERYTIGDLHRSKITAIEWSKNGMRLFSGDKNGVIIMTEIDFYMHLCKSMEIVNEQHEIVQMSYHQNSLLVSSVYRSILCAHAAGRWAVRQIGRRERKTLCAVGAVWQYSYARGGAPQAYCARPGLRLWRADAEGQVLQTLLFKDAITNPLTVAELLNPSATRHSPTTKEFTLGPLHVFREQFLVAHDDRVLFLLDPASQQCVAATDQLRRILSVSVNRDEIFVLEGPRSLVRLAHTPEPAASAALSADDPLNLMTKSLTTLQNAVNSTTSLLDQTVPYISSVLEQPIAMFTRNELVDSQPAVPGEECFELPPIKHLPVNLSEDVLQSIINEFQDTRDAEETRRANSEELQDKLKLYNSYLNRNEELIHSSRRSRRKEGGSGGSTPRRATPVRREGTTTTVPCVMQVSVYSDISQPNDDLLEQQIEEKEKILAKMLNLASLSMAPRNVTDTHPHNDNRNDDTYTPNDKNTPNGINNTPNGINNTPNGNQNGTDKHLPDHISNGFEQSPRNNRKEVSHDVNKPVNTLHGDLVPKVMKLPNNWNLDLELKLDVKGCKDLLMTPDDHLDSEWEII